MRKTFRLLAEAFIIAFVVIAAQRIGYHIGEHYGITNGGTIALVWLFGVFLGMNVGKSVEARRKAKSVREV